MIRLIPLFASCSIAVALATASATTQPTIKSPGPQNPDSSLLDSILYTDARLLPVIQQAAQYEVQIIYTQINRTAQQQPVFSQHSYHLNARQYFNPASMVKLPTVALSLEKLNDLNQSGLTRATPMRTGVAFRCQTPAPYVISADSDQINTIGNYCKRMLLVSDNQAYNRLYEFLGQQPLNQRLAELGYSDVRIVRRFAPCDTTANRYTNPIEFRDAQTRQVVYQQAPTFNPTPYTFPLGRITKGKAYQAGGRIITQPYDFTTANYLPLQSVTDVLKSILFPEATPPAQRFRLKPDDYAFLKYYLHHTPHSSGYSLYKPARYFDAYKKYLYYGRRPGSTPKPGLHIYNIVGMSHGYLADVAYFADTSNQVEFMLSAVLYVNQDGIINDGAYEYELIGMPFLAALGQTIYAYEVRRPKSITPNLTQFVEQETKY